MKTGVRIGFGYDIHRLVKGRKLFLGGVLIPHSKGLLGHSDADVLLHALCDALLGASGLGDIGEHFPDSDPRYRDIPSAKLLKAVLKLVRKKGYALGNIDSVIIAEEPKILPHREKIKRKIAQLLDIREGSISIKGKTNEGLGPVGKREAIAAYVVVALIGG